MNTEPCRQTMPVAGFEFLECVGHIGDHYVAENIETDGVTFSVELEWHQKAPVPLTERYARALTDIRD